MHSRTVSVENSGHLHIEAVLTVIVEEKRLSTSFAFVVARADANWINVTPIAFWLRMDRRIAIDLARRRLENLAAEALGETKHVDGADDRCLRRLDRVVLIMDRRSWTGKVVDFVYFHIKRKAYVMTHELKARVPVQMIDVLLGSREQVVYAKNFVSDVQKVVNEVRSQEPRSSGDENPLSASVNSSHCFPRCSQAAFNFVCKSVRGLEERYQR